MSNKPLVTDFEKIILLGLVFLFGYGIYKNGGTLMYKRSEETTIIDGESSVNIYRELDENEMDFNRNIKGFDESYKMRKKRLNTAYILNRLAQTYSDGKEETKRQMKEMGLTEDEMNYYNNVRKENNHSDHIQDAKEWYNVLKTSASTYEKFKSIVDDFNKRTSGTNNENVLLKDESNLNDFYRNLESAFGISETEAKMFSFLGKKKVSDWVKFIEESERGN